MLLHASATPRLLRVAAPHLRRGPPTAPRLFATVAPPPPTALPAWSPLARAAVGVLIALPAGAALLVVHGTSYGKIYRDTSSTAREFLLREAPLEPAVVATLRAEAMRLADEVLACKRYNFPPGKMGSSVSYAALRTHSPLLCDFYEHMAERVSAVLGERVVPTPHSDNSSCSLLVYSHPGDQIDWHYDLRFYRGRHFTVLVPLLVEGPVDAQLQVVAPLDAELPRARGTGGSPVKHASASQETVLAVLGKHGNVTESGNAFANATIEVVPTVPGSFVVFEGEKVFHRVTPMGASTTPWRSSWMPPDAPPSGTIEAIAPKLRALGAAVGDAASAAKGAVGDAARAAHAAACDARAEAVTCGVRVVLSMTFTTDATATPLAIMQRRLKDMVYFGPLEALLG